jgi:Lipid A 3-O-deacylase (PagL)
MLAADETAEAVIESAPLPAQFGAAESWWWSASAGVGFEVLRDGESYTVSLAGSYFLVDDFSIDLQGSLLFLDQEGDDAVAGSLALLVRQHWWLDDGKTTFFVDGGVGLLGASEDVPAENGAEFGLTPQAGLGFTFPVGTDNARLILGAKWRHISTARLNGSDNNDGRDAVMGYVGVVFPF